MNKATLLALVGVLGYLGFELYAVRKAGYRMEPRYIFAQYAAAERAVSLCGAPEGADTARFVRNLDHVRRRASAALAETDGELPPGTVDKELERIAAEAASRVNAAFEREGCDAREIWKQRRRFEIYARINTG